MIKHFRGQSFTVEAIVGDYYVEYVIYEIKEWNSEGNPLWSDRAYFSPELVDNLSEAEPYLHLSVQFNGCSNWFFGEPSRRRGYGNNRADLFRAGEIMVTCWDWTRDLLENFSPHEV